MRPLPTLAALLCATLLAGCAGSSPIPVDRTPDAELLRECLDPILSNPDTATDNDFAADMLHLAQAYEACKERHHNLIQFEQHR